MSFPPIPPPSRPPDNYPSTPPAPGQQADRWAQPGPSTSVSRTVLFTDVVGSTQRDLTYGDALAAQFRQAHFAMLRAAVTAAGGHEVKRLGDGVMAVFPSVRAALECAVAIQQRVRQHNTSLADSLEVRIGLAHGDVRREDSDYFGPPVVEAARLCAAAEGGQVLATAVVARLAGPAGAPLRPLGALDLKGLAGPVETVEVGWSGVAVPDAEDPSAADPATGGHSLPEHLRRQRRLPLVGRTEEADVLEAARQLAADGERCLVVIGGAAGIGKSRLCQEVALTSLEDDALVLYGACDEDVVTPYQPFVEALDFYVAHGGGTRHPERQLAELGRIVPAVAEFCPDLSLPVERDAEGERYRMFRAVADVLAEAARERLVVLVLEDLHWADSGTLQLLRHVVGATDRARLLILATYRNTDVAVDHPLVSTLASLRREQGVSRLTLNGLDRQEVLALLEAAAGHSMDSFGVELARHLQRETDGNPFFVGEVLLHLLETGAILRRHDGTWVMAVPVTELGLPDSVREVIGHRVARLGTAARRVLSTAAVIGTEFELGLLARACHAEPGALLDLLEGAVAAALVHERSSGEGQFQFTHGLTQQTLYSDLGPTRRAQLHREVAALLEEDGDVERHAAELARHWLAAGAQEDQRRALPYLQLAGDRALAGVAPEEAKRWYASYLERVDSEGDPVGTCRVQVALGEAQRQTGDPAFRESLLAGGRLARDCGAVELLCQAALGNSRGWASVTGRVDTERVELLEEALAAAGGVPSASRARLLATLALELVFSGDFDRRRELARQAVEIARSGEDRATRIFVLQRTHMALQVPELLWERLENSQEGLRLAEEGADPVAAALATTDRLIDAVECGDLSTVDRCFAMLRRRADKIRQPLLQWNAGFAGSWRHLLGGRLSEAEDSAADALQIGLEAGQPDALLIYGAQLCAVRWHQGTLGELGALIEQNVRENPGLPSLRSLHAQALQEAGDRSGVSALLAAERERGFALPYDVAWLSGTTIWGDIAASAGDVPSGAILYERLLRWPDRVAGTGITIEGAVAHVLGRLALLLGRPAEAGQHLLAALDLHRRLEAPFHIARTQLALAEHRRLEGNDGAARELLTQAKGLAEAHGYAGLARRASATLG